MKRTKIVNKKVEQLSSITCNKCGFQVNTTKSMCEEFLEVCHSWGYNSNYDGQTHVFDLCQKCYKKLISKFMYPVQKNNYI